jgi:hypothetical protein
VASYLPSTEQLSAAVVNDATIGSTNVAGFENVFGIDEPLFFCNVKFSPVQPT